VSDKHRSEWVSWEDFRKQFPMDPRRIRRGVEKTLAIVDGVKLAELRQVRGLTQAQMAKRLKIDQSNVSRIERGKFDAIEVRTLRKYVESLSGELEIRVKIDDVSQRLIDSEYEKKMERKFAREEAAKKRKKAPAKLAPKARSMAKRRQSKKVRAKV
jgi:transcriptional regulator with XRE-family HTH domain